jgi:hypothetical protein
MTRNNSCQHVIDISSDILFDQVLIKGKPSGFVRLYGFVKGTPGANKVSGLRFIAYGPLAMLIYSHCMAGSRLFVISHVQQRVQNGKMFTEFVIEEVQYIRNINWERGKKCMADLIECGLLQPNYVDHDNANHEEGIEENEQRKEEGPK